MNAQVAFSGAWPETRSASAIGLCRVTSAMRLIPSRTLENDTIYWLQAITTIKAVKPASWILLEKRKLANPLGRTRSGHRNGKSKTAANGKNLLCHLSARLR